MTLARLARFYSLDPERALALPVYLLAELLDYLPQLQAEEMQAHITVALSPWMKSATLRGLLNRLQAGTEPAPQKPPLKVIEQNPERAREYFARLGAQVE